MFVTRNISPKEKLQRADGAIQSRFFSKDSNTHISDLFQKGCLKMMLPKSDKPSIDAILLNTAGGIAGGDKLSVHVGLEPMAHVSLSTQTAERIYRSDEEFGQSQYYFDLAEMASFFWLAQETILFNQAKLKRQFEIHMSSTSTFLMIEPLVLGRMAMGEVIDEALLHDRWRLYRDGRLCFAENFGVTDITKQRGAASLGTANAFANILFVSPNAESLGCQIEETLTTEKIFAGYSLFDDMIVVRLVANDSYDMRKTLLRLIPIFTQSPPPPVWLM